MKGDLHIHTNISDGSYSTKDTLRMAKENNVTHVGIVNHDTVSGLKEAIDIGKELDIKVIPGVEISAYDYVNNKKVHILGYDFVLEAMSIKKVCEPLLRKRNENSMWQINTLIKEGYDIDVDYIKSKIKESGVIYKQHIMDALIKKHYTDSIYSDLYRRLFKNNGICSKDIQYIDVYDAIKAIKKDGGIVVLAHPGELNSFDIVPELVSMGLDGIELNHHSHNENDKEKVMKLANQYNLLLTGGTDFHGQYSSKFLNIGDIECPIKTLKLF